MKLCTDALDALSLLPAHGERFHAGFFFFFLCYFVVGRLDNCAQLRASLEGNTERTNITVRRDVALMLAGIVILLLQSVEGFI